MLAVSPLTITPPPVITLPGGPLRVEPLARKHEAEVLAFLAERPIHTVIMAGLIRDNGLVSPLNRGSFYDCRNTMGHLEGVALLGHVTMVETRNDAGLDLFAALAQDCQHAHVILGEREKVARFWEFYAPAGQRMRLACRELLFEQRWPLECHESVDLRLATIDDIEQILPVHAQMAFEECGIDPMERDPIGFRQRTARRIEQGRVWVWLDQERLIFKADIVSDTPEAIYLEGIYVNRDERGKGFGVRSISQLGRILLSRTQLLCVLVNEQNRAAQGCYRSAGYKLRGYYDTNYLKQISH